MADFEVYPGRLNNQAMRLKDISNILSNKSKEIDRIKNKIHVSSKVDTVIKSQLSGISMDLLNKRNIMQNMGIKLSEISQQYQNQEKELTSALKKREKIVSVNGSDSGGSSNDTETPWYKKNGAVIGGTVAGAGKIFGMHSAGEASGELLGYSTNGKITFGAKWKTDEKTGERKFDSLSLVDAELSGEGHLAKGSLKGNIGIVSGSASGSVGTVEGKGKLTASLYKDGKFSPQIGAEVSGSAKGLDGNANVTVGNDEYNGHVDAKGTLGSAKANAGVAAGKVNYKNSSGQEVSGWGVKGSAKAEAYIAEGSVSGGVNICGIKIDVSLGGKVGGAGAGVEGGITTGGIGGSATLGVGVGAEIGFNIDWSGFKNPFSGISLWK